jgi:hypothetical protein
LVNASLSVGCGRCAPVSSHAEVTDPSPFFPQAKKMRVSWRSFFAASVVGVFLVGGAGTYALVSGHAPPALVSAVEPPRVETARLFSPSDDRDEIAATLAHRSAPIVWPEPKVPKPAKLVASKVGGTSSEAIRKVPKSPKRRQATRMPELNARTSEQYKVSHPASVPAGRRPGQHKIISFLAIFPPQ